MAREAEVKKQSVFNTGNRVAKPVWTNANRVNHSNKFVPRSVQLNAGRPNINSVRPNINTRRKNVNPVRPRVNTGSSNVNTVRSSQPEPTKTSNNFSPKRPQVNQFNQRRHFSKSHSPMSRPIVRNTARMTYSHAVKGNWGSAVKTSAGYNWRNSNSNCDSRLTFIRTVNAKGPQGRPKPKKAWHRRLGHINFKNLNKLVNGNIVRGLPSKVFKNDQQTIVDACHKVKQYRASSKSKLESLITEPIHTHLMNLIAAQKILIVVPSTMRNTKEKAELRKSSTNSKKEEILTELQQEKKASSTNTSEDNSKISSF
ncbi:ribonuclease H-like domain-containing protein [Tanacetum coccineum]|uniref:Ribonuclease H-like domain-containing protein n=1 Tax=Tanacetum coccineum TaxID=301880 RepID=A0ABQ4ZC27_9ASTR